MELQARPDAQTDALDMLAEVPLHQIDRTAQSVQSDVLSANLTERSIPAWPAGPVSGDRAWAAVK